MTDSDADVKRYAFRLLGYRGRSERELRERLGKKGFPEDAISRTLDFLKETGFIDDSALALTLKRQALDQKLLGYGAARMFMQKRGLSRDLVESSLHYDEDAELRGARKLLEKKLRVIGSHPDKKDRKRLYDFLARRGYSPAVIHKVLMDFNSREGDGEW